MAKNEKLTDSKYQRATKNVSGSFSERLAAFPHVSTLGPLLADPHIQGQ
jgi:hypothetical protein